MLTSLHGTVGASGLHLGILAAGRRGPSETGCADGAPASEGPIAGSGACELLV